MVVSGSGASAPCSTQLGVRILDCAIGREYAHHVAIRALTITVAAAAILCLLALAASSQPASSLPSAAQPATAHVVPDVLSHIVAPPRPAPDELSYFWATHAGRRLAIDPDGAMSVLDEGGHRVVVFGPDGVVRDQWGGFGREEGRLVLPLGLVRAPDGTQYVTDHFNPTDGDRTPARMQRFDAAGRYLGDTVPPGSAESLRLDAIGPDGSLYAVDTRSSTIQRFSPNGDQLASWDRAGPGASPFAGHISLAVGPDGRVWVADYPGAKVHVFTADGEHITSWGELGEGPGQLHHLFVIALGPDGSVYLAPLGALRNQVQRFTADGRYLGPIGEPSGQFGGGVADMAVSPDGTLNVFRQDSGVIERYSPSGQILDTWGHLPEPKYGSGGLFDVGGDGTLWRFDGERLLRFDLLGNLESTFAVTDVVGLDEYYWVPTMAAAPDGSVYLAANGSNDDRLIHVAAAGQMLAQWPVELGYTELNPSLAAAPDGSVYLANSDSHRVSHWDGTGRLLGEWGGTGGGEGEFSGEIVLGVAADGTVLALDRDPWAGFHPGERQLPDRVQRLDASGALLGAWMVADATSSLYTFPGLTYGLAVTPDATSYLPTEGAFGWAAYRTAMVAVSPGGQLRQAFVPPIPPSYDNAQHTTIATGPDGTLVVADPRGLAVLRPDYSPVWRTAYYPDTSWSTWPSVETVSDLDLNWGTDAPLPGLPADGFAARFERVVPSEGGLYHFHVRADGGVRLWVGPRLLVDRWQAAAVDDTADLMLGAGQVPIVLEYTDPGGVASVSLEWSLVRRAATQLALPVLLQGHRGRY